MSLLLSFFFLSLTNSQLDTQCEFTLRKPYYAKFDLSPYMGGRNNNPNPYYCVKDKLATSDPGRNYTYCFNVCNQVQSIPPTCLYPQKALTGWGTGSCINRNKTTGECYQIVNVSRSEPVMAYQTKDQSNELRCYRLSSPNGGKYSGNIDGTAPSWDYPTVSYYDNNDPTRGIVYSYADGDDAGAPCNKNRKLNINFLCENKRYVPPKSEQISENLCEYNLTLSSIYGCPVECPLYSNEICSAQGLCGYDFNNNKPKCFCYSGFGGTDCSADGDIITTESKKSFNGDSKRFKEIPKTVTYTNAEGISSQKFVSIAYDLNPFYREFGLYEVIDKRKGKNYTYYIDVIDDILKDRQSLPKKCQNLTKIDGPCYDNCVSNTSSPKLSPITTAYALQYDAEDDMCYLLGTDFEISLYDKVDDYARGVTLRYTNGGYGDGCQTANKNREFSINFICPDSALKYKWNETYSMKELSTIVTYVIEYEGNKNENQGKCGYYIDIKSPLACPAQCITSVSEDEFKICSGQGKCAADPFAGFVRCICDDGFTGDDCQTVVIKPKQTITEIVKRNYGWLIFAIFVIIIAVTLLILGYRKYKSDLAKVERKYQQKFLDEDSVDPSSQGISHGITSINPDRQTEMGNVNVSLNDDDITDESSDEDKKDSKKEVKKDKKKKNKKKKGYDQMDDGQESD